MSLSVVIPSRTDPYLRQTLQDLLAHAAGPLEVIVVLDGYEPRPGVLDGLPVQVVRFSDNRGMRSAINAGMALATGEFVMKTDEHCAFAAGFDQVLAAECGPDWVVVPRRRRLHPETWTVDDGGKPPVDYMRLINEDGYLRGIKWDARTLERQALLLDDLMTFQGSCYFLRRDYWLRRFHPMDDHPERYGSFANEAQEIGLKAWLSGGRVVVNKRTWYAHWHRTQYNYNFSIRAFQAECERGRKWAADYWLNDRWPAAVHTFDWFLAQFGERRRVYSKRR